MANALYPKFKENSLDGNIDLAANTVKLLLVDTGNYTYNSSHVSLADVPALARVATSPALSTKTLTNGAFKSADFTLSNVSGNSVEALILYVDSGTEATSYLIAYYDTGVTNLPLTPNGGNVDVTVNAAGWFAL